MKPVKTERKSYQRQFQMKLDMSLIQEVLSADRLCRNHFQRETLLFLDSVSLTKEVLCAHRKTGK